MWRNGQESFYDVLSTYIKTLQYILPTMALEVFHLHLAQDLEHLVHNISTFSIKETCSYLYIPL
jgi:hypothetical protein